MTGVGPVEVPGPTGPDGLPVRGLVVAKAPVQGQVKTRLGADVGLDVAARLAAAALLDTLDAYEEVFAPGQRHVAMTGDLAAAEQGEELRSRLAGWAVHEQRGDGLGERLANAHADVAATGPGAVVQVGMDTPQVTAAMLREVVAGLAEAPAVLGHADDGGWWVLGLADGTAGACLVEVPMSTDATGVETQRALEAAGLDVLTCRVLSDVDTVVEADAVAVDAPDTRFARLWREVRG